MDTAEGNNNNDNDDEDDDVDDDNNNTQFFFLECNFIYRTNAYTTYNTNVILLTFTYHYITLYLHYLYKHYLQYI